ncbi:MAG: ribosome maturation factor RimM [Pseudomonadota bacterium]
MSKADASKDLIVVGAIVGAHGVRGDVKVKSFTAVPEDLFDYGPLLGADGAVLIEPVKHRAAKAVFIVTSKTKRQKEEWDALKGTQLHVTRDVLPPTEDDEVYIEELLGLSAVDADGAALGQVKAVQNFGAGDLLEIAPPAGKSIFIPFTEEDVPEIDLEAGKLVVNDWALWADEGEDEG